jgi:hypothetical protein
MGFFFDETVDSGMNGSAASLHCGQRQHICKPNGSGSVGKRHSG